MASLSQLHEMNQNMQLLAALQNAEMACDSHLAFIPSELHENVIELTSVKLDRSSITTVMLGIICPPTYSASMWKTDVKSWEHEFPNSAIYEIDLKALPNSPKLLDAADAIEKINRALPRMNDVSDNHPLRLILLGPGHNVFLNQSIQHLLKEWKTPDGGERRKKIIHFIISADTEKEEIFDLCKQLCLTGVCHSIQFYNTRYYHPFGYYNKP